MAKTLIGTKEVRGIMTKSNLPVGGYSVNPYVGCTNERGAWHHDQVQPPCWWLFGESIRGLHPCLQVLLRLIHEALHRT